MSVVLGEDGRAVIHNRETGQVLLCSVPTALENVENGKGVWAHGEGDGKTAAPSAPRPAPEPEPAIPLTEPDVLPLPEAEATTFRDVSDLQTLDTFLAEEADEPPPAITDRVRPVSDEHVHAEPAKPADPLDHDGNGRKGGAKKAPDPERAAVIKALKAAGIKFFAGAPTEKLKALLPA